MNKRTMFSAIAALSIFCSLFSGCGKNEPSFQTGDSKYLFEIDLAQHGEAINNKLSDINVWMFQNDCVSGWDENFFKENMPFAERIQFMQATGGNDKRDLFLDPYDPSVSDDYNFDELITACRNVLDQGVKPMIKTGNVPLKLSTNNDFGLFGVNLNPPDDYKKYYQYIHDIAEALAAEFGREEVAAWRWGVLTECENKDWFGFVGKEEEAFENYCRLYDTTAAALQSVLGEKIDIGAHSMTIEEGLWDERRFIEHCASGKNYWTGKTGAPLTYLAVSFYDYQMPESPNKARNLPDVIRPLREAAEKAGFKDLDYGVDEGRITCGAQGERTVELASRTVGDTIQGAYDARLLWQMTEHDIDYFSAWSYTSGGLKGGIPTVSMHVAREFYKMVGNSRVGVKKTFQDPNDAEYNALVSVDKDGTLHIMAYAFGKGGEDTVPLRFSANVGAKHAQVKTVRVDDNANFFDEWRADCKAANIGPENFSWSPDSAEVAPATADASIVWGKNYDKYAEAAKLKEESNTYKTQKGRMDLTVEIPRSSVVFLEIKPVK